MRRKGFFISLEGPEGSGKSTQTRWLIAALRRAGRKVVFLRDPGSTILGRQLRQVLLHSDLELLPMMEAALFIGGRVALVEEKILPALRKGSMVVCDRFHDATVVYQGYAGGLSVPWLDRWGRKAIHGVMPRLTILLDLPVKQGFARLRRRHDRMERKEQAFHRRVRAGYRALARRQPQRIIVIDANRSQRTVRQAIEAIVMQRLGTKLKKASPHVLG